MTIKPRSAVRHLERALVQVAFDVTDSADRPDGVGYAGERTDVIHTFDAPLVARIREYLHNYSGQSMYNKMVVGMILNFPLRVEVETDFGVVVQGYGIDAEGRDVIHYSKVQDTPEWMQKKIATLMLIEPPDTVEGVGMRANDNVYWLGDEYGNT